MGSRVLKEYLVKGYAANSRMQAEQRKDLKHAVTLLSNVLDVRRVTRDEAVGLLRVLAGFTYGLDTLDCCDSQT